MQCYLLAVLRVAPACPPSVTEAMLPANARLRTSSDIASTMKKGTKYSSRLLVLHVAAEGSRAPRVAFAVGKSVGNSVIRHLVTRRLRHIVSHYFDQIPAGSQVVVRALPGTSSATFAELEENFLFALSKAKVA